jgi:hypothetical protein
MLQFRVSKIIQYGTQNYDFKLVLGNEVRIQMGNTEVLPKESTKWWSTPRIEGTLLFCPKE